MATQRNPIESPDKLFRLPYASEFYVCSCGAIERNDCTCDQETVVTMHRNPHTADPDLVQWLATLSEPFTIDQAIAALGLANIAANSSAHRIGAVLAAFNELRKCAAHRDEATGLFIPPSAETLSGLHLRRPAHSQLRPAAQQLSPALPADHREPSPASHAGHQSAPADFQAGPLLPQQSA